MCDMEQYKHELEQIDVSKADKTKPERILNSKEHTHSEEVLGVWAGLWITAVHSDHFSWQNCVEDNPHRQFKIC